MIAGLGGTALTVVLVLASACGDSGRGSLVGDPTTTRTSIGQLSFVLPPSYAECSKAEIFANVEQSTYCVKSGRESVPIAVTVYADVAEKPIGFESVSMDEVLASLVAQRERSRETIKGAGLVDVDGLGAALVTSTRNNIHTQELWIRFPSGSLVSIAARDNLTEIDEPAQEAPFQLLVSSLRIGVGSEDYDLPLKN